MEIEGTGPQSESAMADLSDEDKRAIFGANYKAPVVTEAEAKAAKRDTIRNAAIGIAVLAALIFLVIYLRS